MIATAHSESAGKRLAYGPSKRYVERRYGCEIMIVGDRRSDGWSIVVSVWIGGVFERSVSKRAGCKASAVIAALMVIEAEREPVLQKALQLARINENGQFCLFDESRVNKK